MSERKKNILVAAAIIVSDDEKALFATQRGYGEWKDWWEFPGGKIELGETPQQALQREIQEELNTQIDVGDFLTTINYDYPNFHLTMHCYLCHMHSRHFNLQEHEAAKWLTYHELDSIKWLPADREVVSLLKKSHNQKSIQNE